jgi:hypothetical protein
MKYAFWLWFLVSLFFYFCIGLIIYVFRFYESSWVGFNLILITMVFFLCLMNSMRILEDNEVKKK